MRLCIQTTVLQQKQNKEQQVLGRSDRVVSNLATLFDGSDGGSYGALDPLGIRGLGFRAAIPKMPSFRKIVRVIF